ncbi:MAG: AgmX/PglI C-terminal domain-containing protein [Deltaproteobacteria bacterium]|nr:AgmX/PglI C-terminal domain-containing protein [Deltaproteobacteria bacterium]
MKTSGKLVSVVWLLSFVLAVTLVFAAVAGGGKSSKANLKKRFEGLKSKGLLINIKVDPAEKFDEVQLEMEAASMPGLIQVAKKPKPKLPDPKDVVKVVKHHLKEIKHCFKKQVTAMNYGEDELILELTIKKTGKLQEVSVDPEEFGEGPFGKCMARWTKRWRFPGFTGEVDKGIFQENVSMALPLRFSVK